MKAADDSSRYPLATLAVTKDYVDSDDTFEPLIVFRNIFIWARPSVPFQPNYARSHPPNRYLKLTMIGNSKITVARISRAQPMRKNGASPGESWPSAGESLEFTERYDLGSIRLQWIILRGIKRAAFCFPLPAEFMCRAPRRRQFFMRSENERQTLFANNPATLVNNNRIKV